MPRTESALFRFWMPRIAVIGLVLGVIAVASSAASASHAASEQAEARVFARKVNLRASDVPGFKSVAATTGEIETPPGPLPQQVEECDGGPVVNMASHGAASPIFQNQNVPIQTLVSAVYPMRTPSIAFAYIAAADSRRGLGCIQREEIRKRDKQLRGKIEVAALRQPLGGASVSGVRVWRCLVSNQACKNRSVRSFTDRLWFAAGHYVVMLAYIAGARNDAKGPQPQALPLERQLIARLYSRAQALKP
jgi:hypothetical protein